MYCECSAQPHTILCFKAILDTLVLPFLGGIYVSEVQDFSFLLKCVLLLCVSRREAPGVCGVSQHRRIIRKTSKGNARISQNSDIAGRQGKLKKGEIVKCCKSGPYYMSGILYMQVLWSQWGTDWLLFLITLNEVKPVWNNMKVSKSQNFFYLI